MEGGEGLTSYKVVKHHGRIGVMGSVMKFCNNTTWILKVLVLQSDLFSVFLVLNQREESIKRTSTQSFDKSEY